jgi:hypothetical protein
MDISVGLIRQIDKLEPGLREVLFAILEEIGRQRKERVTKDDFQELKQIVMELAQAQARTEARVEELAQAQARTEARVEELAQAQARTEARVEELAQAQVRTEARVEELAQAQARTEARVGELVQAQVRTEARVEELAQAQVRTEARLDSLTQKVELLAEAQLRTEMEVRKLAKSHQQLQQQVGGLSDAVGYGIEDRLMPFVPDYARLEFGLEVESLDRRNVEYANGKYDEVNILASGHLNGEPVFLIGECKAKPGKKDADRFNGMLERLPEVLKGRFFPVLIGYTFSPEVEHYVARKYPHIHLVKTYKVEIQARKMSIKKTTDLSV